MKKRLFYLFALICAVSLFTACSDDDDNGGNNDNNATEALLNKVNTTYEGTTLDLDYSGSSMTGKSVTFLSKNGQTATITLSGAAVALTRENSGFNLKNPGVIPGETSTVLNVTLESANEGFTFKGTETKENFTINYDGSVKEGKMDIDLDVELKNNELIGTWNLKVMDPNNPSDKGAINPGWKSKTPFKVSLFPGVPASDWQPEGLLAFASVMPLIPTSDANTKLNAQEAITKLLQKVEFKKDGNLTATYSETEHLLNPVWETSPMNMVQFAVKENKLMLYLNADAIINAILAPKSTKATEYNPMDAIMKILPNLMKLTPMLEAGIPLSYRMEDENTLLVYIDKELGMQLFEAILPLFEDAEFVAYIKKAATSDPSFASFAPMIESVIDQLPAVIKGTETLELGLRFVK